MKKSRLVITGLVVVQLTTACAARAQLPPFDHRPTADTITTAIQTLGVVGPWSDHADFQGCPDTDPLGPDLIQGLDPTAVSDRATAELAYLWSDELASCGSAPLKGWYSATISHGVTTESGYLGDVLVHLPTPLPAQLSADLTTLAAQSATPAWIRADLLTALSVSTSGLDRLDVFFTNAAAVDPPENWLLIEANFLMRDDEDAYPSRLASEAPGLSDRGLGTALAPVGAAIAAGNLDVADLNVQTILQELENRPGLATAASYITGEPLFEGSPLEQLGGLIDQVAAIIDGAPGSELADKMEDVLSSLETADTELDKDPQDRQAAAGNLEGAASDLESATSDELLTQAEADQLQTDLTAVARGLATEAIAEATAAGGDPSKIQEAHDSVDSGDSLLGAGQYKAAVAAYKDAVSQAEGA